METPEQTLEDFWTEPRRELRAWFQRNAPSLGDLYEGALRMLYDEHFPGRARFISHAIREIRNRLPDVVAGRQGGGRVHYVDRLDKIAEKWERAGFPTDGSLPVTATSRSSEPSTDDVPLPQPLYLKIASLVRDHVEARKRRTKIEAAERLFLAFSPESKPLQDSMRPIIMHWLEVTEWFVKRVHHPGTRDERVNPRELREHFELFEATLRALIRGFFKTVEELDEILEEANS